VAGDGALLPKWTALGVKSKFEATCKMVRSDWPRRWYRGGHPGLHRRGSEWGLPDCIAVVRRTASSRDALNAPDCMQSPAMAVPPSAARGGRQGGGTSAGVAQRKYPPCHLRDGVPAGGDPPSGLKPKRLRHRTAGARLGLPPPDCMNGLPFLPPGELPRTATQKPRPIRSHHLALRFKFCFHA